MVQLEAMRAALPALAPASHGFVAVFVGGTSGIGEAAVKGLARWSTGAKAYVVGRSAASAAQTLAACRARSPASTFEFVQQDIVLLQDVDRVCAGIAQAESKMDLVFMTPDIPTFSPRAETDEGIDRLMSLRYYARMRFVRNLMPLLDKARAPRVVSVLGPKRFEFGFRLDDLGLKHNYGGLVSLSHCSLMTTLCMEEFAARHPAVSFVHVYPGVVLTTNLVSGDLPWIVRKFIRWAIYPLFYLVAQPYDEVGDRMMFISLSAALPPRRASGAGVHVLPGSDGVAGSGSYCVDWKAKRMVDDERLQKLRAQGARERVWEHIMQVFDAL